MDDLKSDNVQAMTPVGNAAIKAAHNLVGAFCWDGSAEGHAYWQGIYDRLHYIASLDKSFALGGDDE